MSDLLDPLPPHLRARLSELLPRLPAGLRLHGLRQTASGWTATLYDGQGNFGAEVALYDEPTLASDGPSTPSHSTHPPAA